MNCRECEKENGSSKAGYIALVWLEKLRLIPVCTKHANDYQADPIKMLNLKGPGTGVSIIPAEDTEALVDAVNNAADDQARWPDKMSRFEGK